MNNRWMNINIVPLPDECTKEDSKSKRNLKRLIEICSLDQGVDFALRIRELSDVGLWEVDLNSMREMHCRDTFFGEGDEGRMHDVVEIEAEKTKLDFARSEFDQFYLVLHKNDVDRFRKQGSGLPCCFSSVKILKEDGRVLEIYPSGDGFPEKAFVCCHPEKSGSMLNVNDYSDFSLGLDLLYLCVDPLYAEYKTELIEIFPGLCRVPEVIQKKMKNIPKVYKNRPERLSALISVYRRYWKNKNLESLTDNEIKTINSSVLSSFNTGQYGGLSDGGNPGKKMVAFAVKVVEPDCVKTGGSKIPNEIYNGVPIRLWILLCAAEFFWRKVKKSKKLSHHDGTHIERVLRFFGSNPQFLVEAMDLPDENGDINIVNYQAALEDYLKILEKYPEICCFQDVSFGSETSLAASIIRPFWVSDQYRPGSPHFI
jgi:hypothetical protein